MRRKPITYKQAKELKSALTELNITDKVSAVGSTSGMTLKAGNNSTNPDVSLIGTDENYFGNYNVAVDYGRAFISSDISLNRNVAIIGNDVLVKLFPSQDPLGKMITIKNQTYEVIGVLETKGAMMGESQDNQVIVPVSHYLRYFADEWEMSLTLAIKAERKDVLQATIDETIGQMRNIRNQKPWEEDSFETETNESLADQFGSFTKYLTYFGFISGAIALIAAGVGIMNIMLVSVKERTREIGVRKAVGAKRRWILVQFIIETITMCQIGGLIGIIIGVGGAWLLGMAISIKMTFPTDWIIFSIVICTVLGLISGVYPAWKAAKLDPIDALRYE
jgi:putative ABC transport system permease protein